jgi:hypothetical protein
LRVIPSKNGQQKNEENIMLSAKNNGHKVAINLTICGALCMLFACGQGEDYYLEPETSLKSGNQTENATILAEIMGSDTDTVGAISLIPNHPTTLNDLPLGALGDEPFVPAEEISPEAPVVVDELPEEDLWAPDEDDAELPEFVEVPESDEGIDMPSPVSLTKLKPIEDLTAQQFSQVCKAIDIMYEDEEAGTLTKGACAYDYARQSFDQNDNETLACDRDLNNCFSDRVTESVDAHIPIGLCDDHQAVPANCEINFAQVQTCLTAHKTSQAALAEQDMCDLNIDTITEARTLIHDHFQAQKCLQKLENHCPALAL